MKYPDLADFAKSQQGVTVNPASMDPATWRRLLASSDREGILAWLQANDPNGSWTDEARRRERGYQPGDEADLAEAKAAMREQLEDYEEELRGNPAAAPRGRPDVVSLERLAKIFDLPDLDDLLERNADFIAEQAHGAQREAEAEGEDGDKAYEEASIATENEIVDQWSDGVLAAAEAIFAHYEIDLAPIKPRRKGARVWEYRVVPRGTTWSMVAQKLVTLINGVGLFHFDNVSDFVRGSKSAKQAVLEHLGQFAHHSAVYGTPSASRLFEQGFRRNPAGACDKCKAGSTAEAACPECGKVYYRCSTHGGDRGAMRSLHAHAALTHTGKGVVTSLPRYDERRGWVGGDSRTLYAFTDSRTGQVFVQPGGGERHAVMGGIGPEATVRMATRSEGEAHWQSPLHSGWRVAEGAAANPRALPTAAQGARLRDRDGGIWTEVEPGSPFLEDEESGERYSRARIEASRGPLVPAGDAHGNPAPAHMHYTTGPARSAYEAGHEAATMAIAAHGHDRVADLVMWSGEYLDLEPLRKQAHYEPAMVRVIETAARAGIDEAIAAHRRKGIAVANPDPDPVFQVVLKSAKKFEDDILSSMARTLWVTAYADCVQERLNAGHTRREVERDGFIVARSGDNWLEVAPDPGAISGELEAEVDKAARQLAALYAAANDGNGMVELLAYAALADGRDREREAIALIFEDGYAEEFGFGMTTLALRTGSSWFDDHEPIPDFKKVFHFESHYDGEQFWWSGSAKGGPQRNPGPTLLGRQSFTIFPERAAAEALAAKLNADDDGSFKYAVCENKRGFFVEIIDTETGERIGTL